MRKLLIILFTSLALVSFGQNITPSQLKPGTVRPVDSGVLADPYELTFDAVQKSYTLAVTSDIVLTLASSGNTAFSRIYIDAAGDGSHILSFPSDWTVTGEYDPNSTQLIEINYYGAFVDVRIRVSETPIVVAILVSAIMDPGTDDLTLSFSSAVTITTAGWSVTASGGAATISAVTSGSGTNSVVFDLSRNITSGEDMTISYNPATGSTVSSTSTELAVITGFFVDTGDEELPDNFLTVGPSGKDFTTWTAATAAAIAGQTIVGYSGTYRETIVAKAGVTYQAASGETPIISGLESISNGSWSVHSGNIYKCTITLNGGNNYIDNNNTNTTLHANQIFKDGVMMIEARYPNVTGVEQLFDRTKLRQRNSTSSWGSPSGSLTDTGIPAIGWTGGKIWITGWYISKTGNITGHSANTITYTNGVANDENAKRFEQYYYLTGRLGGLDIANEWHYDSPNTSDDGTSSNTLYFWQPGNGSPTGVEYKVRNWGFDVRGKANVAIKGLTFIGCDPIQADINSLNTMVDGIRATYINHAVLLTGGGDLYTNARRTGLQIIGPGSTLKNSEIKYGASQGVWLGQACRMENNLIEYINYEGNYGAGVNFWNPGNTSNQVITYNTFTYFGRSAIDFSEWENKYPGHETHLNMDISYNDISHSLMLSADGGQFYGSVYSVLTGLRVHHNWIHDSDAQHTPTAAHVVGVAAGFYFDQGSGPCLFDHNVLWDNNGAGFHTQQNGLPGRHAGKSWIINNTFADVVDDYNNQQSYLTTTTDVYDFQRNNIYADQRYINWYDAGSDNTFPWAPGKGDIANSIFRGTNPLFEGGAVDPTTVATPEDYFELQSGSPARNTGTHITGQTIHNFPDLTVLTADAVGNPDMGAYEDGATKWVAGYNEAVVDEDQWIEDNNATFVAYTGAHITFSNAAFHGGSGTFFNITNDKVTVTFTGTAIELYVEKSNNKGIFEVQVDNVRQDCDTGTGGTQDCDGYAATSANNSTLIFSKTGLSAGTHTLEAIVTGTKHASSSDYHILLDAAKID